MAELLAERISATLELTGAALALAVAVPLGVLAARNRGRMLDSGAMGFSLLGISIPNFWLGPLLILVFSLWLGWPPVSGRDGPASLILPAVTLGSGLGRSWRGWCAAVCWRCWGEDYVRTARAKGVSKAAVIRRHAWLPVLTLVGLQLGGLLGGP